MKAMSSTMFDSVNFIMDKASELSLTQRVLLLFATSTPTLYFLNAAFHNYKLYMALGPGGVTYGVRGWLFNWCLRPFASTDLVSTDMYNDPQTKEEYGDMGQRCFLKEDDKSGEGLPVRKSQRPEVPFFLAPQRQAPRTGHDGKFADRQEEFLHQLVKSNPGVLRVDTSGQEKRGPALFLDKSIHAPEPVDGHTHGEISHIHVACHEEGWHGPPDGSAHCTLSLEDAKEVIEKGWGQRHMMSGKLGAKIVGKGFLMIYAPQDEDEFAIFKRILLAGTRYMSGGMIIKDDSATEKGQRPRQDSGLGV